MRRPKTGASLFAAPVTGWQFMEPCGMNPQFRAVLSPCIGVCRLDDDGLCAGCLRTSGEISRWSQMTDDERLRLMETVLPDREAHRQ